MAGNKRHLRRNAFDAPIYGGSHDGMRARVTAAPQSDAIYIRLWKGLCKCNGVTDVTNLLPRIYLLSDLAIASAEIAMIEDD